MKNTQNKSPAAKTSPQSRKVKQETAGHLDSMNLKHLLNALLEDLPSHIYFKDTESRFIKISKALAQSFNLSDPSEVIGKSDFDFFSKEHADQAYQDEKQIMRTGEPLIMEEKETWPDRPDTWVTTTKMPLRDEKGAIIGTFGISKDITEQKRMEKVLGEEQNLVRALMDNLPDAIYFKNTESRFIRINQTHARWFGLDDPTQAVGKSDFDFFLEELSRQYYDDEQAIMQTGQPFAGKEEKQTSPDGRVRWVSTTKMPLRDQEGRIIGTFGISRDITIEKHLRENIDDLRKDVGRTFHTFSATLLQVNHAIKPAINALGPDPFPPGLSPTVDQTWKELATLRNSLVSTLSNLLEVKETSFQKDALPMEEWSYLEKLLFVLSEVESIHIAEQRAPVLRRAARQVVDISNGIEKSRIRQELVRDVRRNAEQLECMTCLIALRQAQDSIVDTDNLARDLRERVLTGVDQNESPKSCEFWSMVQETIEGLSEYAAHKGVLLKKDNRSEGAYVQIVRKHIIRALNNLLNNAIKYSWWRDQNTDPWIEIRSYIKDNRVYVEIEDYGVPIPRNEIDDNLIFQFGYRGRLSEQRGRIGTGIGLADARGIARAYGGDVTINSRPAPRNVSLDDLSVPHIKTATLFLPLLRLSRGRR